MNPQVSDSDILVDSRTIQIEITPRGTYSCESEIKTFELVKCEEYWNG